MLTDHDTRREHDAYEDPRDDERAGGHDAQMRFPALEEPAWVEDDPDEMMEDEPADSPFRGMWIGIAAAAVTFVLVFAVPQWLGWYDIGGPPQVKRDATPESVITTVTSRSSGTGQPSGAAVVETGPPAPSAAAAPPATAPPATPAPASSRKVAAAKEAATKEPAPREEKPTPPASASKRTFSVQIAAFKTHAPASKLAAKVKRDGYPADVRRTESSEVPWVVRVGSYTSREQAESARDALARKGFRGFII